MMKSQCEFLDTVGLDGVTYVPGDVIDPDGFDSAVIQGLVDAGALSPPGGRAASESPDIPEILKDRGAFEAAVEELYRQVGPGGGLDVHAHPEHFDPETLLPTEDAVRSITGEAVDHASLLPLWNAVGVRWWNDHEPWLETGAGTPAPDAGSGSADDGPDADAGLLKTHMAGGGQLDASAHPENFTGEGLPKTKALEAILGRSVSASERDGLWTVLTGG